VIQIVVLSIYVMACWYTSVDAIFGIEDSNAWMLAIWGLGIFIDITSSLNTVRLDKPKMPHTRNHIFRQYLRQQSYLDVSMLIYVCLGGLQVGKIAEILLSGSVLIILILKLNRKSELLRTYFDLKKYMVMVDSFLLLLVVGHISVRIITK